MIPSISTSIRWSTHALALHFLPPKRQPRYGQAHPRTPKGRLPRWEIFYDHDSIPLGEQFPERLRAKVTSATVVLVIIGPRWLEIFHERKRSRHRSRPRGSEARPRSHHERRAHLVGHAAMPTEADLADSRTCNRCSCAMVGRCARSRFRRRSRTAHRPCQAVRLRRSRGDSGRQVHADRRDRSRRYGGRLSRSKSNRSSTRSPSS